MGELTERYIAQLRDQLPFPDAERDEAVEEIAAHIEAAVSDLVTAGIASEDAERRVLGRFGSTDRLADDLADARRPGIRLLPAMGTALRVSVGTTLWTVVLGWVAILLATLIAGSALTLARNVLHFQPNLSWSSPQNALMSAGIYGLAAFAVGRTVTPAIAVSMRRRATTIKPYVLAIGVAFTGYIGLVGVEAPYDAGGAVLQALLPAWFALGVMRPAVLPSWLPPGNVKGAGVILLLLAVLVGLPLGLLAGSSGNYAPPIANDPLPPGQEPARIAPYAAAVDDLFVSAYSGWMGDHGLTMSWLLAERTALDGWHDLHVEVWLGLGSDNMSGHAILDPAVDDAIARFPVVRSDSGSISSSFAIPVVPGHSHYVVALVGTDPRGDRRQLYQAQDQLAYWSGTAWGFFTAPRP